MLTVVLNADFTYLNTVSWKRGVKLLVKQKAETLKEGDRLIRNAERTKIFKVPVVLKLVRLVKHIYSNKIPYSRRNVFIRDNQTCQYCGNKGRLSIDHVIPSSRGGKTNFKNCVACCVKCNTKKGGRTPREAHMFLEKKPHEPTIMEFLKYKMRDTGAFQLLEDLGVY